MANITDLKKFPLSNTYIDFGTNDFILGTAFADNITVHGGNDVVDAGGGNDVIFDSYARNGGPSGYDTINAGAGNDVILSTFDGGNGYDGGTGIDILQINWTAPGVRVDLQSHYAGRLGGLQNNIVWNIENVVGTINTDVIYGDFNANTLDGYNGEDVLYGRDGADLLFGNRGHDVLYGGNQNDNLQGGDGNDILLGEAGADVISGSTGNDFITGGLGRDVMSGGDDNDKFNFLTLADSGIGALADLITDFERNFDDMNVAGIDANVNAANDQAFTFIGTTGTFGGAAQIRRAYDAGSSTTSLLFNTDADQTAEMTIKLSGNVFVSAGDFYL